jgi:Flp pilus assembly protein TadD
LYLPSIAFAWFLGHGLARLRARLQGERTKQVATLFAGCAFAALASATLVRNEVWRNDLRLWADTAGKTKSDGMPLRNWAAALLQAGELERAETLLHQALTRHNTPAGLSNIHSNLGTIAMYRRQWELAREHYQKAYDIVPSGDMAYNLGVVFLHSSEEVAQEQRRTKLLEAKRWFAQAVASSPHDPDPHLGYGQVLLLLGERDLARQHFQRAFQLGLPPDRAEQARALLERGSP